MAELKFVTGTVACGKTLELILTANQLQTINGNGRIKILKPSIDTRFSQKVVRSAAGIQIKVTDLISPIDNLMHIDYSKTDYILVDEIQFFAVRQVEQLRRISMEMDIEVVCFGLLKDFRCSLFDTSRRLLELCDDVRMVKGFCMLCRGGAEGASKIPSRATVSMKITRVDDSIKPMVDGNSICIGGIDTFIPVCYRCFHAETGRLDE